MSDDDTGPSGTLVIQPEANPAHRTDGSLTSQDEDPATRVVADKPPPQLATSPTVQLEVPEPQLMQPQQPILTGTLQMGIVAPRTPQIVHVDSGDPTFVSRAERPQSAPFPMRRGSDAGRTTAPPPGPSKLVPLVVGVVVAGGVGGVGLWLALRGSPSSKLLHEPSNPSTQANDDTPVAPPTPVPTTSASASAVLPDADVRAKAALQKFRDGLKACVEGTIHKLPGTSPPVPDGMAWLKHGPYASLKRDWASPVFGCVHFQMEEPMPFMIQWQADQQGAHGIGIVWVDGNSDGVPDSAYAFTAQSSGGTVVTSEIEWVDPAKPMVHPP